MKQAVLVTGGAGYVGSHTCKALAKAGYLPVTYDNLSTGHENFVRWGPLVKGDIHDATAISDTLRRYGAIATMHFAANAYIRESIADPAKYYMNNVTGTLSLLAGMRGAECNYIVFSSTCAVYGEPALIPIAESTILAPVNPYGSSKSMVERILADFRAAYDLRSICLRYFNACGADEAAEVGELRNPETHLIARAMMALQGYVDNFQVFGNDFNTLDGTAGKRGRFPGKNVT